MEGNLARRLLAVALAIVLGACIAGPQSEPPAGPDAAAGGFANRDAGEPDDRGMGRSDLDSGAQPPAPPAAYADAGPADEAEGGGPADPSTPWLDADGESGLAGGGVAPFPFQPCCGWFTLPGTDAGPQDAGPDGTAR